VVTVDRRPATYICGAAADGSQAASEGVKLQNVGTQLDAVPTLLGDHMVRLAIRLWHCEGTTEKPRKVRNVATELEMPLGQTLVIGGPIDSCESKTSCHDVQTVLLVTPEEVTAEPPLPTAQAPSQTEAK
jgi:hypothetical protein